MLKTFLFWFYFHKFLWPIFSQCTSPCICSSYFHDELSNLEGPSLCSSQNHCQCDNTRMCSISGDCVSCESLSQCPLIITPCPNGFYQVSSDCVSCEVGCNNCSQADLCLKCNEGYYLTNGICLLLSRPDSAIVLTTPLINNNSEAIWLDTSVTWCPNETWAIGFNIYSNCVDGYGVISIELSCGNLAGAYNTSVRYQNSLSFDSSNSNWGLSQTCLSRDFLNGKI